MEKIVGTGQSFFRLDNFLLWLLIFIVIVLAVIAVLLFKGRGTSEKSEKSEESVEETPVIPKKLKKKFNFKFKKPAREQVIKIEKQVEPAPPALPSPQDRPSNHVIDLKKMKKYFLR